MTLLSKEAIELLEKNETTAAEAKRLKESNFVPQERFNEVNQKAKEAQDALAKIESDRVKAESERQAKEKEETEKRLLEEKNFQGIISAREKDIADREKTIADANVKAETLAKERLDLETKNKKYEESQSKLREQALSTISDADMKEIAAKLPDVEDVIAFATKVNKEKVGVFNGKHESAEHKSGRPRTQQEYLAGK